MIVYKCKKCGSNKYKIKVWELKNGGNHIGVYCAECGRCEKFLGEGEEVVGTFCGIESEKQRERRK